MKSKLLGGLVAVALCAFTAAPGHAAIVGASPNADISTLAYTINLTPSSSLIFDSNTSAFAGTIGVSTTGTTEVFSVFGTPDYFQTFGTTSFPDQQLGSFQAYPTSMSIPFSLAEGIVGFEFSQTDGVHYGLADVGGATVSSYLFDTVPGESVALNATVSAAPEPCTWLLMFAGVAGISLMLRRAKKTMGLRFKDALAA